MRIFLDTCTFNFILDNGEFIFDGVPPPKEFNKRITEDIRAFYNLFFIQIRDSWQLAISHLTYKEIINTNNPKQKYHLENWFLDVWDYWMTVLNESKDIPPPDERERIKLKLLNSGILDVIPDYNDKLLICDAISYHCDVFCTRDWKSILKHRANISSLPIQIITPLEWWNLIRNK